MSNKNQKKQYGIYLGNKYSGIALNSKIISNQRIKNQTIIPTIVAYDNEREDPIIGENMKSQLKSNPKNTIFGFVKLIGKKFSDPEVQEFKKKDKFIIKKKSENEDEIKIVFNCNKKTFEESPEYFLKLIIEQLVKFDNIKHENDFKYIITVPSYFDENQKNIVKNILNEINLKNYKIIYETQALVSTCTQIDIFDNMIFVFCCDGSEFNFSILKEGNLKINKTKYIGKKYFIDKLFKYCADDFKEKTGIDFSDNKNKCDELYNILLEHFNKLSLNNTMIDLETLFYKNKILNVEINQITFQTIFKDFFEECKKLIEECIKESKIEIANVNFFIFNCNKILNFEDFISETFKIKSNKKIILDNKNYEIYPIGASLYRDNEDNENGIEKFAGGGSGDDEEKEIEGESPIKLSLGFDKGDGRMEFVIKKGEKKNFKIEAFYKTQYDMQDSFTIKIFRGERLFVEDNVELGSFKLSNLRRCKKGNIITIEFDYNTKDDTLNVIAYERNNPLNKKCLQNKKRPYLKPFNDMEKILINEPTKFKEEDKKKVKVFFDIENLKVKIAKFEEEILKNYEKEQPVLVKLIRNSLNEIQNNIDYKNYDFFYSKFEECKLIIDDLESSNVDYKTQKETNTKMKNLERENKELTDRVRILQKTIRENKYK